MRFILNILLLTIPIFTIAQMDIYLAEPNDHEADSLHVIYNSTSDDTVKMEVCRMLGFYYHEKNTDSALFFQTLQLELARNLGFRLWEADALELCGFITRNMDRYPASLQYFQQSMRIVEDPNSEKNTWKPEVLSMAGTPSAARLTILAFIHIDIGILYKRTGNYEKELTSFKECVRLAKELNDNILLSLGLGSIGAVFMDRNILDSALYYIQLEIEYTEKSGYYKYYGSALQNVGNINFKQENYESARVYYNKAIKVAKKNGNLRNLGGIYINLSELFLQISQPDSSLFFARKGLYLSEMTRLPNLELLAFKIQTRVFEKTGQIDSAYYYQNLAIVSSESIFGEEKIIHMQNLEFSEQLRLNELKEEKEKYQNKIRTRALLSGLVLILVVAGILYRNSRIRRKAYRLLHQQKNKIQATLAELKNAQSQLVHAEKMASLGELTAGIAHEIQNPLNFVNNFSEVSVDLIEEMDEEITDGNTEEIKAIAGDIKQNLEKIHHHGERASSIVKGMLEHSRAGDGKKEPTDLNAMADEYIRLAYHGLRAKDKSFNADFKADLDKNLPKVEVVGQDIARVVLNILSNAFHACAERSRSATSAEALAKADNSYKPLVTISTKKLDKMVEIKVTDNGGGIPADILDKIFQPFFTTKASGEGTGLGLSLSYDIITKGHGGTIDINPEPDEGTKFIITIPFSNNQNNNPLTNN